MAPNEVGGGVKTCKIDIAADTSSASVSQHQHQLHQHQHHQQQQQQQQRQPRLHNSAHSMAANNIDAPGEPPPSEIVKTTQATGETPTEPEVEHKQHEHKKSSISSSSSSVLTNSIASPSSSLTSILTNSPTSTTEFSTASLNKLQANSEMAATLATAAPSTDPVTDAAGAPSSSPPVASRASLCNRGAQMEDTSQLEAQQHQQQPLFMMTNIEQEASPLEAADSSPPLSHPVVGHVAQQEERAQQQQELGDGPIVVELSGLMDNIELPQQLNSAAPQESLGQLAQQRRQQQPDATTTVDLLANVVVVAQSTTAETQQQHHHDFLSGSIAAAVAHPPLESHHQQQLIEDQSRGFSSSRDCQETRPAGGGVLTRLERSNSCSQAECGQLAADSSLDNLSTIAHLHGTVTSVSHENLASPLSSSSPVQDSSVRVVSSIEVNDKSHLASVEQHNLSHHPNPPTQPIDIVKDRKETTSSSVAGSPSSLTREDNASQQQYSSSFKEKSSFLQSKPQLQQQHQQQQQPTISTTSSFASTSSRFFSSKLNTGSLWSLLSAGSSSSSIMNDHQVLDQQNQSFGDLSCGDNNNTAGQPAARQQNSAANNMQEMAALVASKSSSFLNRYHNQFKLNKQPSSTSNSSSDQQCSNNAASSATNNSGNSQPKLLLSKTASGSIEQQQQQQQLDRRRYRFNVKYIGSALLHRNFTLPMLEWIAKDIRRQTIRGAQSITQRQFTIPSREIILELQFNQLTAISCKDSHCLFVHPMHCVSKYVQLQHDSTCFAYIIRDNKDSPSFCHVFQAKSTSKIHEIFSAIREVATRAQQIQMIKNQEGQQVNGNNASAAAAANRLQKSASTDGHWRSLLTQTSDASLASVGPKSPPISANQPQAPPSPPPLPPPSTTAALYLRQQQLQQLQQQQQQQHAQSLQFDNSYQFEVMFVKRVKLQCRRVPPTFVDDALETLKSFEVLKGNHHIIGDSKSSQIKGSLVSKRIINASVDERQEYDESCQSPTGAQSSLSVAAKRQDDKSSDSNDERRASSVSLSSRVDGAGQEQPVDGGGGHQSAKKNPTSNNHHQPTTSSAGESIRKHSTSIDCLKSLDFSLNFATSKSGQHQGPPPAYSNDFSPYNTITSSDLNERIAAIPVVSSSVSLDHETRQKLARQVRETIQATAANIKRGVYASGDKLDSSTSSKALDSLSCNVVSSVPSVSEPSAASGQLQTDDDDDEANKEEDQKQQKRQQQQDRADEKHSTEHEDLVDCHRRSSACAAGLHGQQRQQSIVGNNFDLFRRASARQVIKNRTMLLLIGKDELCAISIDKHQMLFSKSFNSIVHCLQGNSNRDHFGLICRDSGKINPNTESYAGYVFRCQSDKVVREIMGALKQVIYSSQHNYHGYNSPYNPLNSIAVRQQQFVGVATAPTPTTTATTTAATVMKQPQLLSNSERTLANLQQQQLKVSPKIESASLAAKRGFSNPIELNGATKLATSSGGPSSSAVSVATTPVSTLAARQVQNNFQLNNNQTRAQPPTAPVVSQTQFVPPAKNLIKSMFCDNCPLYWYHRLCCDVESLPAEASKAIILRRIDSSLSDKEQDEVYSRFSEFNIESIEEHNEIFMSILRQQCERKQTKHGQTQAHLAAMAKNASLARQLTNPSSIEQGRSLSATREATASLNDNNNREKLAHHHQRSDSSGGSLVHLLGGANGGGQASLQQQQQSSSLADASSLAIDNLKRAKNSISISIENMLKRRSSGKDDQLEDPAYHQQLTNQLGGAGQLPTRSGSFKSTQGRESRSSSGHHQQQQHQLQQQHNEPNSDDSTGLSNSNLKRSQSTSDYSCNNNNNNNAANSVQRISASTWRDSLSRTINESTDLTSNSLVGFFRRRSSMSRDNQSQETGQRSTMSSGASRESLCADNSGQSRLGLEQPATSRDSRQQSPSRLSVDPSPSTQAGGGTSTPSSMLSGVFWKKSIFDKIRQPIISQVDTQSMDKNGDQNHGQPATSTTNQSPPPPLKRTREELRSLWRKAIFEQITLLKMDKQNQKLQAKATSHSHIQSNTLDDCCNIQRIKLNYRDVPVGKDAPKLWSRLLKQDPTKKVDFIEVARLVRLGVPKVRRGEVWMFLMNQYQLRHGTSFQPADRDYHGDANQTYRSLLTQLSTQQHEIFVDIGRTFPSHPYYSQYLSIGQLSLFNLLKAYSLLDREVGYCQGLSFVAGILLLHVDSEDEAFELMRHLLFNFGLRKQYLPSMNALHLQLYQLTRLLRDHEYDLFAHFDHHDISPSLYAAPWFLTLFASQFPLGFVSRLLDLIFLIGIEAIFRISLKLLAYHRNSILECTCLEATMEFMRSELIKINDKDMADLFDKSMSMDLRNKLIEYEIEYSFYCAEDKARMVNNQIKDMQIRRTTTTTTTSGENSDKKDDTELPKSSEVADATATIIIQHLLANNHLKSLKTDYSY